MVNKQERNMKKFIGIIAIVLTACGGGGSDIASGTWHPIWSVSNCTGVTACAYRTFDESYATEDACMASNVIVNAKILGKPDNVIAECYQSF